MPLHGTRSQSVLTTQSPGASLHSLSPSVAVCHVYYVTKIESSALHEACLSDKAKDDKHGKQTEELARRCYSEEIAKLCRSRLDLRGWA